MSKKNEKNNKSREYIKYCKKRRKNEKKVNFYFNNDNFNSSIENGVCVVDFFATWCGPCKMLAPVFEELSGEMEEVNFFKVDVDQALDIARKYAITTVPTMIIFKDGEVVDKMIGFLPKEHIKSKIQTQL